jgi:hypothetical protein
MKKRDKRKILLAGTGLSPQIVTETLHALAVGQDTPWVPDDIQLITRCEGAERAWLPPTRHRELPGGQHQPVITQAPTRAGFHLRVLPSDVGSRCVDATCPATLRDRRGCRNF